MQDPNARAPYSVLEVRCPNRMSLYSIPDPGDGDMWLGGAPFRTEVSQPIVVRIRKDYEHEQLLPWFGSVPVMSDPFAQALLDAGVDNLDLYDAVLRSVDDKIEYKGFKAVNVIGLIGAADLSRTVFSPLSPSHLIDAHIDSLAIDPAKSHGLLMFRLAEYVGAVLVHERVKRTIKERGFPYVTFTDPSDLVS